MGVLVAYCLVRPGRSQKKPLVYGNWPSERYCPFCTLTGVIVNRGLCLLSDLPDQKEQTDSIGVHWYFPLII